MAKRESLMPKLARVETAIRRVLKDFSSVTEEIDKSLQGRRSESEIALLNRLRAENGVLHKAAQTMLFSLYSASKE